MSIESVMKTINKKLGDDTITFCTEGKGPKNLSNPSGSLTLDMALGGGIARSKIIEIFGDSMAGKTTLAFLYMAERQREGEGYVAFVDFEHAMNKKLAAEYGVDLDKMIYVNPKTAENGVDIIDALIRSGEVRAVIMDSVSAMVPTKIVESSAEQQTMALLARFMGVTMQKLTGIGYENDCTLVFINQIRGTMAMHGPQTTTSGGRALPFYSTQRIQVKRADAIKDGDDQIGHIVKCRVVKNKQAIPFKECQFPLLYGYGVDRVDEISQVAVISGIVVQAGAWFRVIDPDTGEIMNWDGIELKFQGRASLTEFMRQHEDFLDYMEAKIRGIEVEMPKFEGVADEDGYIIDGDEITTEQVA